MRRFAIVVLVLPGAVQGDWPQWRGPSRNGVVVDAPAHWPPTLAKLWSVEVGEGHSSPVIAQGRVFTLTRVGEEEVVRAHHLNDGTQIWEQRYSASAELDSAVGWHGQTPKSTPCVSEGRVYTYGISGVLTCWDAGDGKPLWRKTFERRFRKTWPLYGVATSPIVHDGRLIVWAGGHDQGALLALDSRTGDELWALPVDGPGYSSPVIAELAGTLQLVVQSQRFLIAVDPKTGKELWKQRFTTGYDQNSITPLIAGDLVIHSGYQKPLKALRVARSGNRFQVSDKWEVRSHALYLSSPVVVGTRLFGLSMANGGSLIAVSLADGRVVWKQPNMGDYAALLVARNDLLVQTTEGKLYVVRADDDRWNPVREYQVCDESTWSHPAISGEILVVKDKQRLSAWRLR